MSRLVNKLHLKTASGSLYEIVPQHFGKDPIWIVKKEGKPKGVLLCFGILKNFKRGFFNTVQPGVNNYIDAVKGNNITEIIQAVHSDRHILLGKYIFYVPDIDNLNSILMLLRKITNRDLAKDGMSSLDDAMLSKLGNSTAIVDVKIE